MAAAETWRPFHPERLGSDMAVLEYIAGFYFTTLSGGTLAGNRPNCLVPLGARAASRAGFASVPKEAMPFLEFLDSDEPGTASWYRPSQRADLVVDYAADGRPLGIEIVDPSAVTFEEINCAFDALGLSRPEASELAPLCAA